MALGQSSPGLRSVLSNSAFRNLWSAQGLTQTAQSAIRFVLLVLIERLTGSTIQQGLMIIAFTLPAVIFAPVSGVIIDRWPKKWILLGSNAARVALVLAYLLVLGLLQSGSQGLMLFLLYGITFVMSMVGQFFNPAETSTIPLLVGRDQLMAANSLFSLTLALSQVVGLVILGPLAVKLMGVQPAFLLVGVMYLLAILLVGRIPRDEPARRPQSARSGWQRAWSELKEGGGFVLHQRRVLVSMTHLTLVASLVMVLAMLAPGIASRVLRLAPEDAIVVFAPAGLGMLLAAALLGRFGHRLNKDRLVLLGLAAMVAGFAGFGVVAWRFQASNLALALDASVMSLPPAGAALILATIALSLYLGLTMSGVNIVSQTVLQESSPEHLVGRVFAVQFMLGNLAGIPPMLAVGGLADLIGIPQILVGLSLAVLAVLLFTVAMQGRYRRRPSRRTSPVGDERQAFVSGNGHKPGVGAVVAAPSPTESELDQPRPADSPST